MTTSNSVGTTTLSVARIIEKARMRCGVPPEKLSQAVLASTLENLFLVVSNIANRSMNIWCLEKIYIALSPRKIVYDVPAGTLDLLNVSFCVPVIVGEDTKTISVGATKNTASWTIADGSDVVAFAVKMTSQPDSLVFSGSNDGWATSAQYPLIPQTVVGDWAYYDLGHVLSFSSYSVSPLTSGVIADAKLVSSIRSVPLGQMNHDDYMGLPNKEFLSGTVTSYFYERKLSPKISVWPVPSSDNRFLLAYRHRQVQDVLTMSEQLEVPSHLLDSIIWNLAAMLAFEVPGVSSETKKDLVAMAQSAAANADGGTSDGSPTFIMPAIGCYN